MILLLCHILTFCQSEPSRRTPKCPAVNQAYLFFGLRLDNALAAKDFASLPKRLSRITLLAREAISSDVRTLFGLRLGFAIKSPTFLRVFPLRLGILEISVMVYRCPA